MTAHLQSENRAAPVVLRPGRGCALARGGEIQLVESEGSHEPNIWTAPAGLGVTAGHLLAASALTRRVGTRYLANTISPVLGSR
jgi:hypothetical protein